MGSITANILNVLGYIWNDYMENELLPGITIKEIYIFTWLALILVEFFRIWIFTKITDAADHD